MHKSTITRKSRQLIWLATLLSLVSTGLFVGCFNLDQGGDETPNPIPMQITLMITVEGDGSVDPSSGQFDQGEPLTLTATAADGWRFDRWAGDISRNDNPLTLTPNEDLSIVAVFVEQFTLTTNIVGEGSILLGPPGGIYDAETMVTITANPAVGWNFNHWEIDLTSEESVESLIMDSDKEITAVFVEVEEDDDFPPPPPPPSPNQAPILDAIGNQVVALGSMLNLTLTASDPEGDTLSFTAEPMPLLTNATLSATTGIFTFTPAETQVGDFTLTFFVNDGTLNDSETITITVEGPPVGGQTALTGRLLDANTFALDSVELPIVGATITLLGTGVSSMTDAEGRFTLMGVPADSQILDIDSKLAEAAPDGSPYAGFREEITLIEGVTNVIARPLFMPRIDASSLTTVNPNEMTMVENPNLNIMLEIPAHTAKAEDGSDFTGQLSISEVPRDLAPAALPDELDPGLLVTIQPVGVTFANPVPIAFPNTDNLPAGSELDIWSLDADTGQFVIVGVGRVSDDETVVETISGGIRAADWHTSLPPAPGSDDDDNNDDNQDSKKDCKANIASSVAIASGNLVIDHVLPSYLSLGQARTSHLVYNSTSADPRPVISSTTTIVVRAAVPPIVSAGLTVGGVELGTDVFTDTSALSESMDEIIKQSVQFDASGFETGRYPYRLKLTSRYAQSSISSSLRGGVLINNMKNSPFGAGWGLSGLQRIHTNQNNGLLLTDGDGSSKFFRLQFDDTAGGTLIFSDDFEAEVSPQWSTNLTSITPVGGRNFLGEFGNETVSLVLENLPPHSAIKVSLDLYILKSWDGSGSVGPDTWTFRTDKGNIHVNATFCNVTGKLQTYPDNIGEGLNPEQTGASEFDTLGYSFHGDSVYNISAIFAHSDTSLLVEFIGSMLQSLSDESWGIDNVEVRLVEATGTPLSPPGDFSTLNINDDDTFTQVLKNGTQNHFNAEGLLTSVVDRNGNTVEYANDDADRLISIVDPVGLVTMFTYANDRLTSITDPVGRTTNFEHDAQGNLVRITDPDGSKLQYSYDAHHRLISKTSKRGFDTTYTYSFAGRLQSVTRPDGSTRGLTPSQTAGLIDPDSGLGGDGNPAPVVRPGDADSGFMDGNGNITRIETDRFGAATKRIDALGRRTTATRDENSNPTETLSPNGTTSSMTYDSRGNLLTITEAQGQPEQSLTTLTYEPNLSHVTSITDPAGNVTTFEYDANGNVTRSTNALGGERTMTYDSRGLPLSVTDENGNTTTFTRNDNGNVSMITDALGNVSILSRDAAGNVASTTDGIGTPQERTNSFTYDSHNRRLSSTNSTGATVLITYDAAGNVTELQNATGESTSLSYDALNQITMIMRPAKGTIRFTYDGNGNVINKIDAQGNVTTYEYDEADQLVSIVDALGGEQQFTYDIQGNLTSFQDSLGQLTTYEYDALNRQTQRTNALGQSTTFTYDSRSRLLTTTNPNGQVSTMTYDVVSRLTSFETADNITSQTYDAAGNLLTLVDNDSSLLFSYDKLNRIVTEQTLDVGVQAPVTITSTFNAVGNRIGIADTYGGTTVQSYDAEDRLIRIVTPAGGDIDFTHDPAGGLTQILFPNGVASDFLYDSSGRLTRLNHAMAGGDSLVDLTYTQNVAGDITSIAEGGQVTNVTYDALRAVTGGGTTASLETYAYDAGGNRISSHLSDTYHYDAANRLLEDDTFTYMYDANGSLTSKTAKNDGSVTDFIWNGQGQLIQIDLPNGTMTTYRYDGFGRRIEKNVDGTITRYVYDGSNILLEFNDTTTLIARYIHGTQIDQPLSMERNGQSFYYHADHLGSVRRLSSSDGTVVNTMDYDSFGQLSTLVEGTTNPFSFTGRERDAESGLYFYRARYYDPIIGRFISEDPVGFLGGDSNLYGYVGNNPINENDPTGLTNLVTTIPPLGQLARSLIAQGVRPELLANAARGLAAIEEIAAFELTVAEVGAATTAVEAGAGTAAGGGTTAAAAGGTTLAGVAAATGVGLVIAAVVISPWAYSAYAANEGAKLSEKQAALSLLRLQVFRAQKDPCLSRADIRKLKKVENLLNQAIAEGGELGESRGKRIERLLSAAIRNSTR